MEGWRGRGKLKILYVADRNSPFDHDAGSGVDFMIYQQLKKNGYDPALVGPFKMRYNLFERLYHAFHRRFMTKRPAKYTRSYLRYTAGEIEKAIKQSDPDVIFTKRAITLAFCQIDKPLVYLTDTTLLGAIEQWDVHTNLANKRMLAWETRVISMSNQMITNSDWAAKILRDQYHVPPERITVYANASSLPANVVPEKLEFETVNFDTIRLLMVGKVYYRKGADIAIEVLRLLKERGYKAELRIVGMEGTDEEDVQFMGLYKKTVQEELEAYVSHYKWAHFFVHPARFEASGIVPSEAAAFGIPTITNATGGLPTTVKDGISGVVLPKDSAAEAYVYTILSFVENPQRYQEIRRTTRQRYETEVNWDYAGKRIIEVLEKAATGSERKK